MRSLDVFLRYSEALDRADLATMSTLVHDRFRLEGAGLDGIGKSEFLAAMKAQLDAFSGYSENPTNIREQDDVVHFIAHVTGKHTGIFALPGADPILPTGRAIKLPPEPAWVRIRDDKLVVYWVAKVPGGGIDGILAQISGT
jgi:hypothetical protein